MCNDFLRIKVESPERKAIFTEFLNNDDLDIVFHSVISKLSGSDYQHGHINSMSLNEGHFKRAG